MALLELHVDVGEGLTDALPQRDQAVIDHDDIENGGCNDAENDPGGHGRELLMKNGAAERPSRQNYFRHAFIPRFRREYVQTAEAGAR